MSSIHSLTRLWGRERTNDENYKLYLLEVNKLVSYVGITRIVRMYS